MRLSMIEAGMIKARSVLLLILKVLRFRCLGVYRLGFRGLGVGVWGFRVKDSGV